MDDFRFRGLFQRGNDYFDSSSEWKSRWIRFVVWFDQTYWEGEVLSAEFSVMITSTAFLPCSFLMTNGPAKESLIFFGPAKLVKLAVEMRTCSPIWNSGSWWVLSHLSLL